MDVPGRLRRLRTAMSEQGCEALLISNLVNVRYLSGFSGSAGVLVVRADDVVLVTDGRYGTQAPAELEAAGAPVEVEVTPASGQGEVLARLVGGAHRLGLEAEHISWGRQRQFVRTWAGGGAPDFATSRSLRSTTYLMPSRDRYWASPGVAVPLSRTCSTVSSISM